MDCRTFHKNLEDYLEGGLDFSGRFGMERHAQQCIGCGETLAGAQRLRQMASGLKRVKAPPDFESSVLNKIAAHKSQGRFSGLRSLWIYGIEWPSWRKLSLASSSLIVLGLVLFYAYHRPAPDQGSVAAPVAVEPAKAPAKAIDKPMEIINSNIKNDTAAKFDQPLMKKPAAGAMEASGEAMIYIVYLGLAYIQLTDSHIRIDFIFSRISTKTRNGIDIIACLLGIIFFGFIVWFSFQAALHSLKIREVVWGSVEFPVYPQRFIISLGSLMMMIQLTLDLIQAVLHLKKPVEPEAPGIKAEVI